MKKTTSHANVIRIVCFLLLCLPFLHAQTSPKVTKIEIKHVGPPATSDALIMANIRVKEGDIYQRAKVDDDVRNLYATGYFYNIRVAENITGDGIALTYVLQGNPLLTDIKFTGNTRFNNKKLLGINTIPTTGEIMFNSKAKDKVEALIGQPLNESSLFLATQEMQKKYEKAGYQGTTVKYVLNIDENAGRGSVTFEINEAPRVRIKEITFEGANSFKQKKLRKQLKTKQKRWYSWLTGSNKMKKEQFEEDKERLLEFYQNEGFIDFEIKEVKFEHPTPKRMNIRFIVSEGKRYKVGTVSITGNKLFSNEDLNKGIFVEGRPVRMQMIAGSTFTPKGLTKDVEALTDFYGSKGYIDTRVNAVKIANTTAGTMDLAYEITEGDKSFIERIDIKGNEKTKDRVIRRELAVSPGEVYDMTRVKLSKERLEGLNFFGKVDTRDEATDVPDRKNLVIGVEEKSTGNFTVGAGFSSVDAIVGFVEVSQSNFDLFKPPTFTGGGQKFRMRAQLGSSRADYQISFVEPWFLQKKLAFGVDLFHRQLDFVSRQDKYDETHTGGTLSLTRALWSDFLIGKVSYTLEHINVGLGDNLIAPTVTTVTNNGIPVSTTNLATGNASQDIIDEGGGRLVSSVGTSLAYDTRNHALLPNRGQRSELLAEVAGVGGDTHFYKLEAKTAWYFPGFAEGHILELVGRVGVVDDYGNGDRGRPRVPIFDRWFLGGLYSLRGYRYREVGPKDAYGEPLGGETYLFASAEYSIPIIERLRLAFFYDVGNVYQNAYSFNAGGRRFVSDDIGMGLRINIPSIGPLRLDYGIPMQHDSGTSKSGRFQFGVGYTREF